MTEESKESMMMSTITLADRIKFAWWTKQQLHVNKILCVGNAAIMCGKTVGGETKSKRRQRKIIIDGKRQ